MAVFWLDVSEAHRRRMLEIVDIFREQGVLDEMGVGTIRDALSELLFPGISTIQTAARYFLFVPWVCRRLEAERPRPGSGTARLRRLEGQLVKSLKAGQAGDGIIGVNKGERTQRLPSSVYWNGLATFGIRRLHGSANDYIRFVEGRRSLRSTSGVGELDAVGASLGAWAIDLAPPDDFLEHADFKLSRDEAAFLAERMAMADEHSLLAALVRRREKPRGGEYPWTVDCLAELPEETRRRLDHARCFSDATYGGALLYNVMLCELTPSYSERGDEYRDWLDAWWARIGTEHDQLRAWNPTATLELALRVNPRIGQPTLDFVHRWVAAVRAAKGPTDRELCDLIRARESSIKRSQSRFDNERARDRWNGASGTAPLNFRWRQARRILTDVADGWGRL
jgi:hypothetical protein